MKKQKIERGRGGVGAGRGRERERDGEKSAKPRLEVCSRELILGEDGRELFSLPQKSQQKRSPDPMILFGG